LQSIWLFATIKIMKITSQKKINIRVAGHIYAIVLQEWEGDREYVVRVPVFPEIVTQGASIIESKAMAKEAIELCLKCNEKQFYGDHSNFKSKRSSAVALAARV